MKKFHTERRGCFSYLLAALVGAGQLAATLLTALFKFLAWLVAGIIALGKQLWGLKFTLPLVGEGVRTNGLVALGGVVAAIVGLVALCNLSAVGLRAVGILPTYTLTPAPTVAPTSTRPPTRTPTATATHTATPTVTPTPTRTPTITPTPLPTLTPSATLTPTATLPPSPTATATPRPPTATPRPPSATATPRPPDATATPKPPAATNAPVCDCSGNLLNCGDFKTHRAAQACYDYCISQGRGDVHDIDGNDKDGRACESLP